MRLKALDLFCCAGGASRGLGNAGFDVVGVDVEAQSEYPFAFLRTSALDLPIDFLRTFDLIWASPPCQFATAYRRRGGNIKPAVNLIPQTRAMLQQAGVPYIIENVEGAREHLRDPVMLCGSMFGLDVRRHRLFECSFPVPQPSCDHGVWTARFPGATNRKNLRKTVEVGVYRIPLEVQRKAMGIDWMSLGKLSQAIPPAYSEYLALAARAHLMTRKRAA